MKKLILSLSAVLAATLTFGQFQISGKIAPAKKKQINNTKAPVAVISYCQDEFVNGIGPIDNVDFSVAIQLPTKTMAKYTGKFIQKVAVGVKPSAMNNMTLKIWSDINTPEGTVVYSQVIDINTLQDGWNLIELETPFAIDGSNLYVGYTIFDINNATYLSPGPAEEHGYGDLVYSTTTNPDGNWNNLLNMTEGAYNFNFPIKVHVGNEATEWQDITITKVESPYSHCGLGASETFTANLKNEGNQDITEDFNIAYKINDNEEVLIPVTGGIAVNAEKSVDFNIDLSQDGQYLIKTYNKLETDPNAMNDSITKFIVNSSPETLPYLENFDEENFAWTFENLDNDKGTWTFMDNNYVNPTGCMFYIYDKEVAANDYLYSNCLDLEASATYKIKFKYKKEGFAETPAKIKVFIGEAPVASSMNTEIIDLDNIQSDWEFNELDHYFTVPDNGIYYIAFQAYGEAAGETSKTIILEDFYIEKYKTNDVGIFSTDKINSECGLTEATVNVNVKNYGSVSLTNVPIQYTVNNGTPIIEKIPELPFNKIVEYTFNQKVDLSVAGQEYLIVTKTNLDNDENTTNDTGEEMSVTHVIPSNLPFANDFASEDKLLGWNIEDGNNDGNTWIFVDMNGEQYMGCQGGNESAGDDYLYSSCIEMIAGVKYTLKFKYGTMATTTPEKLKVFIGNEQSASAMNTEIIDLGEFSNYDFLQSTMKDIQVPTDGVYYLGFYGYSEPNVSWKIRLDDIELIAETTNTENLNTSKIAIYPNPASDIIIVNNAENADVSIMNILGQVLVSQKINSNNETVNVNKLSEGTYIVSIKRGNKISTKKLNIIKQIVN